MGSVGLYSFQTWCNNVRCQPHDSSLYMTHERFVCSRFPPRAGGERGIVGGVFGGCAWHRQLTPCTCVVGLQQFWCESLCTPWAIAALRRHRIHEVMSPRQISMPGNLELVPLAKRVPKPRKTGDTDLDSTKELQFFGFQKIITHLTHRPDLILEALGWIETKIGTDMSKEPDADECFAKTVVTFGRLPSDWVAAWCQKQAGGALTDEMLVKMLKVEPQSIERLQTFALQCPKTLCLPEEAKLKKVCAACSASGPRRCGAASTGSGWPTSRAMAASIGVPEATRLCAQSGRILGRGP